MYNIGEHVCALPKQPKCANIAPMAPWWRHLRCWLRRATLACDWHTGAIENLRSRTNLAAEQKRQLASKHWYIVHPFSAASLIWQCLVAAVWAATLVYVPLIAFAQENTHINRFIVHSNIVGFMDIAANFLTGYHDSYNKEIIIEPVKIAKHYIRRTFVFDLISTIPFTSFNLLEPTRVEPEEMCLYTLKFFRYFALHKYWGVINQQLQLSYAKVVIIKCVVQTLLFLHWLTYVYYQFPIFMAHFHHGKVPKNSWLSLRHIRRNEETAVALYAASFYYVTGLAIGAGYYNPADDHLVDEIVLTSVIAIAGLVFFSYIMMELIRLGMHASYQVYTFSAKLKEVKEYMNDIRLPLDLQNKILLYINYKYDGTFFEDDSILDNLSDYMKQEISLFSCRRLVESVAGFNDLPKVLLGVIISYVKSEVYLPGDILIESGQLCDSLYFISRGTAAVISSGQEKRHLNAGSLFGEAVLINPNQISDVDIISVEICEVYRLESADLKQCLAPYPHLRRQVEEATRQKRQENVLHDRRRSTYSLNAETPL